MSEVNPLLEPEKVIPGCKVVSIFRLQAGRPTIKAIGMGLILFATAMLMTLYLFPDAPADYYNRAIMMLFVGVVGALFGHYHKHDTDKYWFRVTVPDESLVKLVNHYYIIGMTKEGCYDILPCNFRFKIDFDV